ncbi:hypothetical protein CEXT_456261 [Caerostris extrusa]|uniref:Transposase n=1 Tax=Caerostris extrusa TaxID=172846 RepID=A0AAV4N9F2_CAEEX|nr:hypothetical protein CEXT_456261 [Caerostris extrusa]
MGKKRDLWPLVKNYVHPETAVICTDKAGQYKKIDRLIKGVVHKTTNHSKGEFVDKNDTINPLEKENKHLKKAIVYRKCFGNIRLHTIPEEPGLIIWAKKKEFRGADMAVYPRCKRSLPWMPQIRPGNDTN